MAIILKKNRFFSVRWKLISTYISLIIIILLIINLFLYNSFLSNKIEESKINLKTQANIISNQINTLFDSIENNQYSKQYVNQLIKEYSLDIGSRILLIDNNKKIILDSSNSNINNIGIGSNNEINRALEGKEVSNIYKYEDRRLLYTAIPVTDKGEILGTVFISKDADDLFTDVKDTMSLVIFISLISVLITALISYIFADIITEPLIKLTNGVKSIIEGDLETKIELNENDELGQLSESFNIMTTKLRQVEERRKKFVSNVSHELRTPMTSIKILSDTIMEQDHWDEAIYRDFMKDINSEIVRLNNIINDLLYLVEVEKDEVNFEYELTYINYLIENVIEHLKPIANKKGLKLKFVQKEKVQIYVDKNKLYRALLNLVNNSIKYTNEGYVEVEISTSKNNVIIKVIDTGVGIPEEEVKYIFDRFYKVDKSRKRMKTSSGLGLSIAQEIIQMHNGNIYVKSEVNQGSVFSIVLPKKTEI